MRWVRASEQTTGVTEGEEEVLEERKKSEGKSKSRKKASERARAVSFLFFPTLSSLGRSLPLPFHYPKLVTRSLFVLVSSVCLTSTHSQRERAKEREGERERREIRASAASKS